MYVYQSVDRIVQFAGSGRRDVRGGLCSRPPSESIESCNVLYVVGLRSLCSWASLNEAIQDQSVSTHVFYVTILIMQNMHAHLFMLAKNGDFVKTCTKLF